MNYKNFMVVVFLIALCLPGLVLAQAPFVPLVGIPGINPSSNFSEYINALYALAISVAALIAVIKIIIAGVKYMLTGLVSSKEAAKEDIQSALFGLLIIAAAYLILYQINPNLTTSNLLLTKVDPMPSSRSAVGTGGSAPLGNNGTTPSSGTPATAEAIPAGGVNGYYERGTFPGFYLSENTAPQPRRMECTGSCEQMTQCYNSGGQPVGGPPTRGIFYCSTTVERSFICSDRDREVPNPSGGAPTIFNERNCSQQLMQCYNRTEEMQRAVWLSGQGRCITNINAVFPNSTGGTSSGE